MLMSIYKRVCAKYSGWEKLMSVAVILLLIGLGFGIFTVGTVRYLKALEVEAKKAVESAEQEKTCAEQGERTEKQKKREELDTMFSAGLISRDEYDCARKKYEE